MLEQPVTAVVTVLMVAILVLPILFRLAHSLPLIMVGGCIQVIAFIYICFHYRSLDVLATRRRRSRKFTCPFELDHPDHWDRECSSFISNNQPQSPYNYGNSEEINEVLASIIDLAIRDFVKSWYQRISTDETFISNLRGEIDHIVVKLQDRLLKIDFAQFLVEKLLKLTNEHVSSFNKALEAARVKVIKHGGEPEANKIILAKYQALHKAINLTSTDQEAEIKRHLGESISKIFPFILSQKEQNSKIVCLLLREILGSLLLGSVTLNFSDPDFINQLIETQLTQQMNDRIDVKKLREFIELSVSKQTNDKELNRNDVFDHFNISLKLSSKQIEIYNREFASCSDETYLSKCLHYICWKSSRLIQLATNDDPKTVLKFKKRTEKLMIIIQSRLDDLKEISNHIGIYKNGAASSTSLVLQPTPHVSIAALPLYAFQHVLAHPVLSDYFIQWMNRRQDRKVLLDYYFAAEALRNPLEYIDMEEASKKSQISEIEMQSSSRASLTTSPFLASSSIAESGSEIAPLSKSHSGFLHSNRKPLSVKSDKSNDFGTGILSLNDELSQAEDIYVLWEKFFYSKVLHIPFSLSEPVQHFVEFYRENLDNLNDVNRELSELYINSRKSIFQLQVIIYIRMRQSDYKVFKESDIYLRMCAEELVLKSETLHDLESNTSSNISIKDVNTDGDPLSTYIENGEHYLDVNMTGKVGENVVKAVQEVVAQIMKDNKLANDVESDNLNTESTFNLSENENDKQLAGSSKDKSGINNGDSNNHNDKYDNDSNDFISNADRNNNHDKNSNEEKLLIGEKRISRLVSDDVAHDLFGSIRDKGLFGDDKAGSLLFSEDPVSDCTRGNADYESMVSSSNSLVDDVRGVRNGNIRFAINMEDEYANEGDDEVESGAMESSIDDIKELKSSNIMSNQLTFNLEIERLLTEIEKLYQQKQVIEALLKKAEIINNVPETKLLTRSMMSLEREIAFKELQKKQYLMQEANNSLFAKCLVQISSFFIDKDSNDKEFISYVIDVTKFSDTNMQIISEKFAVHRRFNEFYELNSYLKSNYPFVNSLQFPKKKIVLKFQQEIIVEERMTFLDTYLKQLIKNEKVCSDVVFRTFLSTEPFDINNIKQYVKDIKKNETKRFADLNISDTPTYSTFIQPITDLILTLFQLNTDTGKWIKGKTLVIMFQQFFGSTLEKLIRNSISSKLESEGAVLDILNKLKGGLWPEGEWRRKKPLRTEAEKERSKEQARIMLQLFLSDTCSKLLGSESSSIAAETIWAILQKETLNRHFMLSVIDEFIKFVFT